jgi:hypothetical protein
MNTLTLLLEARFLEGWRDNPDKLAQFGYGNGDGDAD